MTDRQSDVLLFIAGEIRATQIPPTIREIGAHLGISNNAVVDHLRRLRAQGLLHATDGRARSLRLTPEGWSAITVTASGAPN